MRYCSLILLVAASISVCIFAQAPAGAIKGSVVTASKKAALHEAVITLTSPDLRGSRIALTDSLGNFAIANLVAGNYTITFEMEGYKTCARSNVSVSQGRTISMNIKMVRSKAGSPINKEPIILVSEIKNE